MKGPGFTEAAQLRSGALGLLKKDFMTPGPQALDGGETVCSRVTQERRSTRTPQERAFANKQVSQTMRWIHIGVIVAFAAVISDLRASEP